MSKDWRKDKPEASSDDRGSSIALDSLGIPILEEVVAAEDPIPFDQELLNELTNHLRSQLKQDMGNIIGSMANVVVANINSELTRQVRMQLTKIFDQHLDRMINRAISDIKKDKDVN